MQIPNALDKCLIYLLPWIKVILLHETELWIPLRESLLFVFLLYHEIQNRIAFPIWVLGRKSETLQILLKFITSCFLITCAKL